MESGAPILIALLVMVVITILMGVKTVPQGQEWTVERLGRYTRTLPPGLSVILPYIDRIGSKLSMMVQPPFQFLKVFVRSTSIYHSS